MLQRNLYTGLTRARKLAVLVGTWRALTIAVKIDNTEARFTQLAARFGAAVERLAVVALPHHVGRSR
jgi:exodeoxyribonuclease V alpha subunit